MMKQLKVSGELFEAERIVKSDDSIIGYIGQIEAFSFRGITDFSLFTIEGEYDKPEKDIAQEIEILKQQLAESRVENERLAAESNANQMALMELHMMLLGVVAPDEG